jgi:16S rRNA (guanine966-N2)-methyltransferase
VPDAGRVIAGSARGIRLQAPGEGTRPLGDRVKQTLFAILDPDLPGARVLDLFAGSGAAGIEALSRGASSATFVDKAPAATRAIEANLRATHLAGPNAEVVRADASTWLARRRRSGAGFDLVIVDPPYRETALLLDLLASLEPVLAPSGRVVAKHFWRDRPAERIGILSVERERRFGETVLTFYRADEREAEESE